MAYDERALRGVGGWLALLIAALGLFTPLRTVFEMIGLWSLDASVIGLTADKVIPLQRVGTGFSVLRLAIAFYVAWRLYSVHVPATVRIAIRGLWLLALVTPIAETLVWTAFLGASDELLGSVVVQAVQGTVFAGLWTAYLLRSRRVANTYTPDHDSADVFA